MGFRISLAAILLVMILFENAYRKFKHPFSDGIYIAEPASRQSYECLVKIALLRGVFGPCIGPRWLMSTQFDLLRECRPSRIVSPMVGPVLA